MTEEEEKKEKNYYRGILGVSYMDAADTLLKWNAYSSIVNDYQFSSIYVAMQWHYLGCSHPDRVTLI